MSDLLTWVFSHAGGALDVGLGAIAIQLVLSLKKLVESQAKMNDSQDKLLTTIVATQQSHEGRIVALEVAVKPIGFVA